MQCARLLISPLKKSPPPTPPPSLMPLFVPLFRWYGSEPLLLWHSGPSEHHDPWDGPHSGTVPRLQGGEWEGLLRGSMPGKMTVFRRPTCCQVSALFFFFFTFNPQLVQETTASMETGDLCADTAPMPKSKMCQDPGAVSDICGVATYKNTPYNNYMSYTGKIKHIFKVNTLLAMLKGMPSARILMKQH